MKKRTLEVVLSEKTKPLWGLMRIHQRLPLNQQFFTQTFEDVQKSIFLNDQLDNLSAHLQIRQETLGADVDIYLVDSGLFFEHDEFKSKQNKLTRFHLLKDCFDGTGHDQLGHGSHIASIIAGESMGVAQAAQVFVIKAFDQNRTTTIEILLSALDAVLSHHQDKKTKSTLRPSILHMSFAVARSERLDRKVKELTKVGIICVAACGHYNSSMKDYSPGALSEVICAGAVNLDDQVLNQKSFQLESEGPQTVRVGSNWGSEIDVWAPGADIGGASIHGVDEYRSHSGSSQAAAYVTGVIACFLERNPNATPHLAKSWLLDEATKNNISFAGFPENHGSTANLLYNSQQNLDPRWQLSQDACLGIFQPGDLINVKLDCASRENTNVQFEIISGELPLGLNLTADGRVQGMAKLNLDQKYRYHHFSVRATSDEGHSAERLFFCITTQAAHAHQFEDYSSMALLAKGTCYSPWTFCGSGKWIDLHNTVACCFAGWAQVTTEGGHKKNISDVKIGERVLTVDGYETVTDVVRVPLAERGLFGINGRKPFVTGDHPLATEQGYQTFETFEVNASSQIKAGTVLLRGSEGSNEVVKTCSVAYRSESEVIHLKTDGSNYYLVEGFVSYGGYDPLKARLHLKTTVNQEQL